MSQGQRPQTQVRGGVRDATQAELDRVDRLVDEDLAQFEFLQKYIPQNQPSGQQMDNHFAVTPMAVLAAVLDHLRLVLADVGADALQKTRGLQVMHIV